jgi:hypothetical protein
MPDDFRLGTYRMGEVARINLINLFTFYLTAIFLVGTFRRLRQYRDIVELVRTMPGRWPRVLQQIKKHWVMFLTWSTFRPAIVAIILIVGQMICSRIIWPQAQLTLHDLFDEWKMLPIVGLAALAMVGVDFYFIIRVGRIDRPETERYLDEAEHWMTSWKAPAIRIFTFGYINPRRIVDTEVRKALEEGKGLLHRNLWWISVQAALRVTFGLCLWLAWAVHPTLGREDKGEGAVWPAPVQAGHLQPPGRIC